MGSEVRNNSFWESPPQAPREELAVNHGVHKQIIAALIVSMSALNSGLAIGWIIPLSNTLKSSTSPAGPLTETEISSVRLIPYYSSLIAAFIIGVVANYYGRKSALFLGSVLNIIGSAILANAVNLIDLYVGRALSGFTIVTGILLGPMILSEIAHPSIRGTLISVCTFQMNLGTLGAYVTGYYLHYVTCNVVYVIIPTVQLLLIMIVIRESPFFLQSKSRILEAEGSLFWYNGSNRSVAKTQLSVLIKFFKPPPTRKLIVSRGARNAVFVSLGLIALQRLSGISIFLACGKVLFEKAGFDLSCTHSFIILASMQSITSFIGMTLIDYVGRKPLMYISHSGNLIALLIVDLYFFAQDRGANMSTENWLPLFSLVFFVLCYNIGLGTIAPIIANEISPVELKGIICGFDGFLSLLLALATFGGYPFFNKSSDNYLNFLIPTIINVGGLLFTWISVPETKGKTLQEISEVVNRHE